MKFGVCANVSEASAVAAAGWDYLEINVQTVLRAAVTDAEWEAQRPTNIALPVPAANSLVPADLKITGPAADPARLEAYMATVMRRAKATGISILVFGSGGARNVPDGFDRGQAKQQIIHFAATSAALAAKHGITLVLEPLNRGECNIINSMAEGMEYIRAVNHPHFQILLDTYHFWLESEPLKNLEAALPHLRHVHVADKEGRVAPGLSGKADYRPVFSLLKKSGYDRLISFEGTAITDFPTTAPKVLSYLKQQWQLA